MEENIVSSVNAEPVVNVEPQNNEPVNNEPVKTNNAEVVEPQTEPVKQVQTSEENAKFAEMRRAREQAETKAAQIERDYMISKQYGANWGVHSEQDIIDKYGHQGICTFDDFKEAVWRAEMQEQGMNPDLIKKYVSEDPDVQWAREFRTKQESENFANANKKDFLDWFKQENERDFDTTKDEIPEDVLQQSVMYEKSKGKEGKSLKDAYVYHANAQLKAKLAEYEAKLKANETNKANATASTGSVTGNGGVSSDFISRDVFEANKNNRSWVIRNLSKISESRANW